MKKATDISIESSEPMLVNAKIGRFVSFGKYNDESFKELFLEAGIKFDIQERPPSQISYLD